MLRLKLASRAATRPESHSFCLGFRGMLCCLALALGLLLIAPASGLANPITDENAKAGTSGWEVTHVDAGLIDGYSDKTSIAPGESMTFHVSTTPSASYRIRIFRLGWYNGTGARLIGCLGSTFQAAPTCSTTSSGSARSTPNPNAQTGEIDASNNNGAANWPVTNTLSTTNTANWTTGQYVAEYTLTSGSQAGTARYSPFVVRSNAPLTSASSILVIVPFNTYNAYNNWGGTSAYVNDTNKSIFSGNHAYKVSFNRPTYRREWRYWDLPMLRFLEREGYDVSYASDTDVDANPQILQQHQAVIVSGHSEYWSKNMRDGFDAARDAGTNLMFMGANDAYWQVRYEDSSCADDNTVCGTVGDRRTMVIYKQEAGDANDPISNSSLKTIKWRDLGRPECELQGGVQYGSWFPNDGYRDYTTTAAGAGDPWAQGSGLSSGTTVKGLVGFEYDSFFPDCDPPGTPTILFQYQGPETSADIDAAAVRYTASESGARVFSSGSEQWAWGLDSYRWDPTLFTGIPATNPAIQQYTRNMLADMQKPAAPTGVGATRSGSSILIDTTPRTDPRITSYKIYRHAGSADFKPGDAGVTLVCQNDSGDCTDNPTPGAYRYASVAVDQWNDSDAALSQVADNSIPPTAVNDSATLTEDAAATAVPVLSNDINPSGNPMSITAVSQPTNGQVVITGGGTGVTYKPNADYCNNPPGTSLDAFTYTINGGSTASVSMTVTCVDDAPVAVHDSKSVSEDDPATAVGVLANDSDIDGGTKEVASFTQPAHGAVTGVGTAGHWTDVRYQPSANYCNFVNGHPELAGPTDDFNYTLNGGTSTTVTMTVDCKDDPAVANDDSATVTEDDPATAIPVLNNDSDVEGDPFSIISTTNPAHGTVQITGSGSGLTYKPNADYCGADSFTYTVTGGDTATVSITVTCVNDPPVAVNDSKSVIEDDPATAVDVLANDTDIDGGPKTVASVTQPAHGTVVKNGDGSGLTYKPNADYCNFVSGHPELSGPSDDFNYTLNGGSTASVSMTVDCVDDPPVANNDSATVTEDVPATAIPVLSNDTDLDGGQKGIASVTQPANGTVDTSGGGAVLTYKPNANYCNNPPGTNRDTFSYTLNGGSTAQVSVTVNCVDDPPTAANDSATVTEDANATAVAVLTNDSDIDGGPKTINSVDTTGTHGTVAITGGGSGLTYKPDANYCNTPSAPVDTFTYTLNGGSTATVSMTVTCVDDPPHAVADSDTVTGNSGANAIGVLANDTDIDGGPKTISSFTQPTHGAVAGTGGSAGAWTSLTYDPDQGYCGPDSFSYSLNGGSSAPVSITVDCSGAPTAVDDTATVTEDDPATAIEVLANDDDPDGGTNTIQGTSQPAHGTVAITGGGTGLTYKPNANYCNTPSDPKDVFNYTLNGGSAGQVSVTVTCVNDDPTAANDTGTVTEDASATQIPVLANDNDIEGDAITISAVTQPTNGQVVITGVGTGVTYRPNANYCNTPSDPKDTFTYTVNGNSPSKTATVSMTVTCVDDPPVAVDDSFTVLGESGANSLAVLTNDTDIDGGPKAITGVTQPDNGTVNLTGSASLTYTPKPGYCSDPSTTDDFTYTLAGGSSATVSVTVDCSQPPVANNDSASVTEDDPATAIPVLSNDTDPDGGQKTIQSVSGAAHGTVMITGSGTGLTYKPATDYCNNPPGTGKDTFTYTLNGGSTATVSMTVACVDDPPHATDDSASITEGAGATAIVVLGNDGDIDGGPKTINSVTQGAHGSVDITGGGTGLTYVLDDSYCNRTNGPPANPSDSFTYTLNGGSTGNVTVTIACVDDDPIAEGDVKSVSGNSGPTALDVLSNDTDVDAGPKAIDAALDQDPQHGTVVVAVNGRSLTYQPEHGYCGDDSFAYKLVPGGASATVSLTVDCSAPPVAHDDNHTVAQNAAATSIDVLGNDTDGGDGGPMLINDASDPVHGTVVVDDASLGLNYEPDAGYCNTTSGPTDNFSYTLNGGSQATVFMTVTCPSVSVTPPNATQQPKARKCKKKGKKGKKGKKKKCKKKSKRK